MCGIAGILRRDAALDVVSPYRDASEHDDEQRLERAMECLRHRGPEHVGFYRDGPLCLGHRRLSILDLTPAGHQPMASRDGRLVVALNGEIYNFIELRRELEDKGHKFRTGTDTEVLLAAFSEWGPACLDRTRGMFALALWDRKRQSLLLARDRMGEKPLFYWRDGEQLAFASELKGLLPLLARRPGLSPQAVDDYLHYQYALEPGTLLDGVWKLPAGHVLEVSAERLDAEPREYWNLFDAQPRTDEPVVGLRDVLESAVELTLRSDAAVGVGLSAGIDSGLIAAIAARKRRDVTAFTVGYPGTREFDEREGARRLAERLDIPWHSAELPTGDFASYFPRLVAAIDEPIADVAAYGHHAVARLARDHGVKVLLTGIGGDELFFGYSWVNEALRLSRIKQRALGASMTTRARAALLQSIVERPQLLNLAANRRLPSWWRTAVNRAVDLGRVDIARADEWVFYQLDYHWNPATIFAPQVFARDFAARLPARSAHRLMCGLSSHRGDPQLGICKLLFDSWLISNCLALGDRVSMASSVETRLPLLDARLVEAVVGYWKAGRTEDSSGHKVWLRAIARDLLPADVLDRPKTGFITPTREWMAAVNAAYSPLLEDGTLIEEGVLDRDRLRDWLRKTPAHIHRDFFLYKLTLLEIWNRGVVRGETISSVDATAAVPPGSAGSGPASR